MKVSVIIPTYNRFEYVLNAIESVKNQTYKDVEVIVVNDCSTQQQYYTDHPQLMGDNVFLTNLPKNSRDVFGIVSPGGHARNIGMMLASGDYIAFLDDDDYWLPEKLEKQISQMEARDCSWGLYSYRAVLLFSVAHSHGIRYRVNYCFFRCLVCNFVIDSDSRSSSRHLAVVGSRRGLCRNCDGDAPGHR